MRTWRPTKPPRSILSGSGAQHGFPQQSHQYSGHVCCSMVNGVVSISTCWTTRGNVGLSRKVPPQPGQSSRLWVAKNVTCSGGKGSRACMHVVAGLAADGTLLAVGALGRLRFDNVRRRRLRRRRGILLGRRQLLAQAHQFRFERGHLDRKNLALGAHLRC